MSIATDCSDLKDKDRATPTTTKAATTPPGGEQKNCLRARYAAVRRYRQRHPLRRMWALFVMRARRRFGAETTRWTWQEHGSATVEAAIERSQVRATAPEPSGAAFERWLAQTHVLTWTRGAKSVALDRTVLRRRP